MGVRYILFPTLHAIPSLYAMRNLELFFSLTQEKLTQSVRFILAMGGGDRVFTAQSETLSVKEWISPMINAIKSCDILLATKMARKAMD